MDDSIRTAKYLTFDMHYPTRQCLVCGTLENYSASVTACDTSLPWLCDRCRNTLLKPFEDANTSNALNALEQENKEGKEEVTDRNVGKWVPVTEGLPKEVGKYLVCGRWRGKQTEIWVCEFMTLGLLEGWANNATNPSVTHWMPLPKPPKGE